MKVVLTIFLCLLFSNRSTCKLSDQMEDTTQQLKDLLFLLNEKSDNVTLSLHIENIQSCMTDYNNLLLNPNSAAARSNFRKCNDIIGNVLEVWRYISGPFLFSEFYRQEDGTSKRQAIETFFLHLYTNFVDGCTILVTTEKTFNPSSTLYRDECWKMVEDINSSMKDFYGFWTWIKQPRLFVFFPPDFQSHCLIDTSSWRVVTLIVLENNFLLFQFLLLESRDP